MVDKVTKAGGVEAGDPAAVVAGAEPSAPPTTDPVVTGEDARSASERLAMLGSAASSIPTHLGKKEVESFVEQIVPAKFRDRPKLVRETCREVMGRQPFERGRHLVPIALRHTLPVFLFDTKFIATLSSEPLRLALDPKQPREILDHNHRLLLEQAVAFMGNWNPYAIRRLLESTSDLAGVLVWNITPSVLGQLRTFNAAEERWNLWLDERRIEEATRERYSPDYGKIIDFSIDDRGLRLLLDLAIGEEEEPINVMGKTSFGRYATVMEILRERFVPSDPERDFSILDVGAGAQYLREPLPESLTAQRFFHPEPLELAFLHPRARVRALDISGIAVDSIRQRPQGVVFTTPASSGLANLSRYHQSVIALGPHQRHQHPSGLHSLFVSIPDEIADRVTATQLDVATESFGPGEVDLVFCANMEYYFLSGKWGSLYTQINLIKMLSNVRLGGHLVLTREEGDQNLPPLSDDELRLFGFELAHPPIPLKGELQKGYVYQRISRSPFLQKMHDRIESAQARARAEVERERAPRADPPVTPADAPSTMADEVEREVEALIDKWIHPVIVLPAGVERPRDITFQGEKYELGQEDFNSVANDALERSGSRKRFFFSPMSEGHTTVVYGVAYREQKVEAFGRTVRIIEMGSPEVSHDMDEFTRGFNDSESTVILLRERIEHALTSALKATLVRPPVATRQGRIRELMRETGGPSPNRIRLLSELVQTHELGHLVLQQGYGFEYVALRQELVKLGNRTLLNLDEAFCDLFVLERITGMAVSDGESAREAFMLWATMRGTSTNTIHETIIHAILMGGVSFKGEKPEIDWARLTKLTESFKIFLHGIFAQIVFHIEVGLLGATSEDNPADVRRNYLTQRREVARLLAATGEIKTRSSHLWEKLAGANIVQFVLSQNDNLGRPKTETFASDMQLYARIVDDWMRENLGLTDEEVPFGAPPVTSYRLTGPSKPIVQVMSASPDPRVSASFEVPTFQHELIPTEETPSEGSPAPDRASTAAEISEPVERERPIGIDFRDLLNAIRRVRTGVRLTNEQLATLERAATDGTLWALLASSQPLRDSLLQALDNDLVVAWIGEGKRDLFERAIRATTQAAKPRPPNVTFDDGYGDEARWGPHLTRNKGAISLAAKMLLAGLRLRVPQGERPTILVLGAGLCVDIPLEELVQDWNAVLVDSNTEYLRDAVQGVSEGNRQRVSTAMKDLTGNVSNLLKAKILRIIERAENPQEASDALVALLDRMHVPIPVLDDDTSADFVISSMAVSQLTTEATDSMIEVLQQQGWRLPGDRTLHAWLRLKGRVQRAHVTALAEFVERTGKPVYLSSEVVKIPRGVSQEIDPEGRLFNEQGKPLPHLVNLLDGLNVDLLPVDEWEWDFDGTEKTFYVEALMIVPKGTAAQWCDLATKVAGARPSPPVTTLPLTPSSSAKQPQPEADPPPAEADRQGKGNDGPTRAAGGLVVEGRDKRPRTGDQGPVTENRVEGNLALKADHGPWTMDYGPKDVGPQFIAPVASTQQLAPITKRPDLRTYALTHLRTKLIALAQARGLGDVAALLTRLTDQQLVTVLKTSRLWKKILERNGLGDRVPSIREEKISAADRLFLALAGLSRSRLDLAAIMARIQPGQETNPPISPVIGIPAGIAGMARGGSALPIVR